MLTCAQFQIDPLTFHATLTDFGLSRIMSGTMVCSTRTMMAGTPGFQSPEQLQAKNIGLPRLLTGIFVALGSYSPATYYSTEIGANG